MNLNGLKSFFEITPQTLIHVYWEGNIRSACKANLLQLSSVVINIGGFFFAGQPNQDMPHHIPKGYSDNYAILIPCDKTCKI
ncbi:hypothetical protein J3U21_04010 [Gilliamella sp. B2776]|uniref:hypothetical protein n=1 Tax=unclassified Gilliamella TaxID=2685620 RepID=UPI00226ACE92|nr:MULTISPECIES: hypothetical protein [unclassified Gilliamella]MCX8649699.1 hypothetical protein [Gilliamella sp. B2779]MCX8654058.1 hypothetical protein [Gilliamella sp. B2737]MCX8657295.1 hypothetical protein [Gilliamella sp. B2894]MCX8665085.1 hypothetical protein [Gilliamella sp. B2887]MCX8691311.1 hypothetical protein [Gilliamella sp. B2776]